MVMNLISVVLIAVSLALDAFAVSVSCGISVPGFGLKQAIKVGVWFGLFQFLMPFAGWLLGTGVSTYIQAIDHFVAFGLLALIGGQMIAGAVKKGAGEQEAAPADLSARRLCVLAVATSIDALAVGVSMAFMTVDILTSAAIIGAVAFCLSVVGGLMGKRLGGLFQKRAERLGGVVLVGIGLKILLEHLLG